MRNGTRRPKGQDINSSDKTSNGRGHYAGPGDQFVDVGQDIAGFCLCIVERSDQKEVVTQQINTVG